MAENKNPAKQILDVSRNMGDIASQLKKKLTGGTEGNPEDLKNSGSAADFINPLESLIGGSKKSDAGIKDSLSGKEAPFGKKLNDLKEDILSGTLEDGVSVKGALEKGGEVKDPGNYVVGENGPEVVNLPEGSSVIPLDVTDLIEGLSKVSEIKNSISDNKISVDSKNRLIKTITGDLSLDMLVRNYSDAVSMDVASGDNSNESVLALSSLQKLSDKIKSTPTEAQISTSEQNKVTEQKLEPKEKETSQAKEEPEVADEKKRGKKSRKEKKEPEGKTAEENLKTKPRGEKEKRNLERPIEVKDKTIIPSESAFMVGIKNWDVITDYDIKGDTIKILGGRYKNKESKLSDFPTWDDSYLDSLQRVIVKKSEDDTKYKSALKITDSLGKSLGVVSPSEGEKPSTEGPKEGESLIKTSEQKLSPKISEPSPSSDLIEKEGTPKEKREKEIADGKTQIKQEKGVELVVQPEDEKKKETGRKEKEKTAGEILIPKSKSGEKEIQEKNEISDEKLGKKGNFPVESKSSEQKLLRKNEPPIREEKATERSESTEKSKKSKQESESPKERKVVTKKSSEKNKGEKEGRRNLKPKKDEKNKDRESKKYKNERSKNERDVVSPGSRRSDKKGRRSVFLEKLEDKLKNREKKVGALDVNRVKDLITGKTPVKGALRTGGEVKDPGNYLVGENGPEVVNIPAKSSIMPFDVSDIVEGLSKVSEIKNSITDNKIEVDTNDKLVKTSEGDLSLDMLVRNYSDAVKMDVASGLKPVESSLALSSLQKLSERVSAGPIQEQQPASLKKEARLGEAKDQGRTPLPSTFVGKEGATVSNPPAENKKETSGKKEKTGSENKTAEQKLVPESKIEKSNPDSDKNVTEGIKQESTVAQSQTIEQKLVAKTKGPSPAEIEAEKKRLLEEDPEWYSDKDNLDEEIKYFIRSYNFKAESAKKMLALPTGENSEKTATSESAEAKSKAIEGKTNLSDKNKIISTESKTAETPVGEGKDKSNKKGEKKGFLENLFDKKKSEKGESKSIAPSKEGKGTDNSEGKSAEKGILPKKEETPMSLSSKAKSEILPGGEKKESSFDFTKILDEKKSDNVGKSGADDKKTPGETGKNDGFGSKVASLVTNPLQKMKKIEPTGDSAKASSDGKKGLLDKIKDKAKDIFPSKEGSFKGSLESKLINKIGGTKDKILGGKTGEEKAETLMAKGSINPLKQPLNVGKIVSGAKTGVIGQKTGEIASGVKSKIEKSVSTLSEKGMENKQQEKTKEPSNPLPEKTKSPAESTTPKEINQEKQEKKQDKETKGSESQSGSNQSGSDGMDDIKGLLSQIAISLSSPVTFYNPDPFRPDSRRI